jgi:hypothetical protein
MGTLRGVGVRSVVRSRSSWVRFGGIALVLVLIIVGFTGLRGAAPASAVTGSDFVAGNIISDDLFYDPAGMSQSDIQSFLNSKIGSCTNGQCLNVLSDTLPTEPLTVSPSGNTRCTALAGGLMSAAAIIFQVQQACSISARVILVTLQKEQGLVTSKAPTAAALARAMGESCPDSGTCATTSLGFANQVYLGARQLKTYKANDFALQPGVHTILYSPNTSCGSSVVDIQNYATAALYSYTPYQPDAAALANLGGTGDGCSSYGNRNFWTYYNSWFGSTAGAPPIATANAAIAEPAQYLFARDGSGNLLLYPEDGHSGWLASGQIGSGWSGMTALVAAGDFDGRGHQDVFARDAAGGLWDYARDGAGGWLPAKQVGSGWNIFTTIIGAGDFTGDGYEDILAEEANGSLLLYPGNGLGGWLAPSTIGSGWQGFTALVGGADFNGDGHPDVVALDASGHLWLYPGNGKGGWLPRVSMATGLGGYVAVVSAGDFDGDGKPDLLAEDSSGQLWLYPGNAAGGLGSPTLVGSGWSTMTSIFGLVAPSVRPAGGPLDTTPGTGDFTGDGKQDILGRDSLGTLWVYPGNGSGGWLPPASISSGWQGDTFLFGVGDFSGDGRRDELAVDSAGNLWLYGATATGSFLPRVQIGTGWQGFSAVFGVGDFNGDGHPDVMARDSAGNLWLYPGNGTGGWLAPVRVGTGWNSLNSVVGVGDFNGDTHPDVIGRDSAGNLWLYPGNGTGGWLAPVKVGTGWGGFNTIFSAGDFNGDGSRDLMARDSSGTLWLYPGNGTGGWLAPSKVGVGWNGFSLLG